MNKQPLVVAILDGFGISNYENGNAPLGAKMENIKTIHQNYPWTLLEASGEAAGFVQNTYATCENSHLILGSGRIVSSYSKTINDAINNNSFFENKELLRAIEEAKARNKTHIHIIGLISKSPIIGFKDDVFALCKLAREHNLTPIVHAITDGKDVRKKSAIAYLTDLDNALKVYDGKLADISGRYYALDTTNHYSRTIKVWNMMTHHDSDSFSDFLSYVDQQYNNSSTDEFFTPEYNSKYDDTKISDDDVILLATYRDSIQLVDLMLNIHEDDKDHYSHLNNLFITALTPENKIKNIAFEIPVQQNTLIDVLANNNLKVLRVSDDLRINEITYQFDGLKTPDFTNVHEIKVDIDSIKNVTYDLTPQLVATEITNKVVESLDNYNVIFANYSNPDILGHTGNIEATIKGLKVIDLCIGTLYDEVVNKAHGCLMILSDHGNCEQMLDENDNALTFHSMNKVPFILCERKISLRNDKVGIADVAPTILNYLNLPIPSEMTGTSLIKQPSGWTKFTNLFKKKDIALELKVINQEDLDKILTTISLNNEVSSTKYVDENDFSTLEP